MCCLLSLTPRQSFSLRLVHFHCCRRLMNIRRSRFTISSKSYIPLHNFETSKSMPGKPKLHWLDMEQALSTKSCGQNPIIRTSLRLLETIESEFRQDKVLKRIEVFRQLDAWYCCRLHADATKIHQRSHRPCSSPLPKLPHSQALWFPRLWLKRLHERWIALLGRCSIVLSEVVVLYSLGTVWTVLSSKWLLSVRYMQHKHLQQKPGAFALGRAERCSCDTKVKPGPLRRDS